MRLADRLGIDVLCLASLGRWAYLPTQAECIEANRQTLAIMRAYPQRIWGWCYVTPTQAGWADEVRRCLEEFGMIGIKLWVSNRCTDAATRPLVEMAIAYEVPVLMHAWWKATGNIPSESTPEQFASLARLYPQAKLIMAHLGGDWLRGLSAVAQTTAYVDTSGSLIELGMIERAVQELGAGRVIFGSDLYGVSLAVALEKVVGSSIPDEAKSAILGDNFLKLVNRG